MQEKGWYCTQVRKGWLYRALDIMTPRGVRRVEYVAHPRRYEEVLVDGASACRHWSFLWYAPRFEFTIDNAVCVVEVRVWPWWALRAVRLTVNGSITYSEGYGESRAIAGRS
jgi:hypothetical protein